MTSQYLSIKDTCEQFKVSQSTLRRKIKTLDKKNVIKRRGKYLIKYSCLVNNYSLKQPIDIASSSDCSHELKDLQETNKMYSFMLSEKDKLLAEKDKQIEILERQVQQQFSTLDQSQKLSALEKQLEIIKLEKI